MLPEMHMSLKVVDPKMADPVTINSVRERTFGKDISSDASPLCWMETIPSDVSNRMLVLLTPASGAWFSSCDLPPPGQVLLYGAPVSSSYFHI
ncbi:hypothetical protein FF1_019972 [Malus domestica]